MCRFRKATANPRNLEHGLRRISAIGSPTVYLRGMRRIMFQLWGFYCNNRRCFERSLYYKWLLMCRCPVQKDSVL